MLKCQVKRMRSASHTKSKLEHWKIVKKRINNCAMQCFGNREKNGTASAKEQARFTANVQTAGAQTSISSRELLSSQIPG